MQYLYHEKAGEHTIQIRDELYRYLFKVRRFNATQILSFRNLTDQNLYRYKILSIGKKEAVIEHIETITDNYMLPKTLHLIWCIIDPKVIYNTLPMLNQTGLAKISFVYCQYSQKQFKIDLDRAKRILINSSQQSGRRDLMELEILSSFEELLRKYEDFCVLDFDGESEWQGCRSALIGCEGGFSETERSLLEKHKKIGFKTSNILKSETAALSFAIKSLI